MASTPPTCFHQSDVRHETEEGDTQEQIWEDAAEPTKPSSCGTHAGSIWRTPTQGNLTEPTGLAGSVLPLPVSPRAICLVPAAPASPWPDSRAVQPGRARSEQGATVNKRHEKKGNEQPTPVKPLWCALLFQLVLSQCTGSPSLPHILASLLLDPAGDCKAFIHIYHWGTQAACLTNRREKGSSVFCF